MGIGVSVFLLALGAILAFAVHTTVSGVSIQVIGVILMVAGAIGLAMTMLVFGRRDRVGGAVVEDRVVTRERDVY
jgi:membrane-bound ClpP family serine protease